MSNTLCYGLLHGLFDSTGSWLFMYTYVSDGDLVKCYVSGTACLMLILKLYQVMVDDVFNDHSE